MPKIQRRHYRLAKRYVDSSISNKESEPSTSFQTPQLNLGEHSTSFHTPQLNLGEESNENVQLASTSSTSSNEPEWLDDSSCEVSVVNNSNCLPVSSLRDSLANWAVEHKIPQIAVNDLLKTLQPFHPCLPLDARTLLATPREYEVKAIEPGYYYHFGIDKCLASLLSRCDSSKLINLSCLEVIINIDGLPLAKSSCSQVYPILCCLCVNETVVDMIGIYHGYEKPKDPNKFLSEFITETLQITEMGFTFNGKLYAFHIKGFVCDVPAKSFILFTKGHSGYYSCTKCNIEGNYVNNRVCFPEKNFDLRTDNDFRQKAQFEHHTGTSVIEQLPNFNMIDNFVLDPMHLLYLGVVKKLIHLWCTGRPPSKLSMRDIEQISQSMILFRNCIPCEFNRKPRSLVEYKRWKATEFRQFLLYSGPVVLRLVLKKDLYLNFLSLHVGITLLSNKRLQTQFVEQANSCLSYFFDTFLILYGRENASHNIHNLLHLSNDTKNFGVLDKFSAFHFENYMSSILHMIRKNEKPLQQIIRRKGEISSCSLSQTSNTSSKNAKFVKQHYSGPVINRNCRSQQFSQVIFLNFTLKTCCPDNCCTLKDGSIVLAMNFIIENNKKFILGKKFTKMTDFYTEPCHSSELGIYLVEEEDLSLIELWDIEKVDFKCILLKFQNTSSVILPLVHI